MNAKRITIILAGVMCMYLVFGGVRCVAAGPAETVRPTLDRLLKAVEANDYEDFLVNSTDEVKAGLTKQMLEGVSGQLSPRMKKGYDCSFLGELKQQGCQVFLWKMTFKDGNDDILVTLVLKEDKVAGFWLK